MEREPTGTDVASREPNGEDADVPRSPYSAVALILTNLIPLFGIVFLHWSLLSVIFLYWMESAIVGFYNILKLRKIGESASTFFIVFFILHYGFFMCGHLVFILALFGPRQVASSPSDPSFPLVFDLGILVAFVSLFISHGISYYSNFVARDEGENVSLQDQMMRPYKRIAVMHLTIIFGGGMAAVFGAPPAALVVMIILKIAADLIAHVKEHSPR